MGRQSGYDLGRLLVTVLATVAAVCLIIGGLAFVGVLAFFVLGMASFGSNK
ncbi:hypothetical protein SAMN05443665_1005254 [Actinomadura meyerae]|uniref:Uncharacterized protein n=1 Tax=Actinomadura meyerae TaxID=240840 RepID=A0A239FCW9_9ACTN|nr:hypothetical protein [Actinomadura meyerae]SNS54002.1 hypothetical protein SAMN05443665_1005254 [Actinomadura meyerae]